MSDEAEADAERPRGGPRNRSLDDAARVRDDTSSERKAPRLAELGPEALGLRAERRKLAVDLLFDPTERRSELRLDRRGHVDLHHAAERAHLAASRECEGHARGSEAVLRRETERHRRRRAPLRLARRVAAAPSTRLGAGAHVRANDERVALDRDGERSAIDGVSQVPGDPDALVPLLGEPGRHLALELLRERCKLELDVCDQPR